MIGDTNDVLSRFQRWLPTGWFPNTPGTRIYALASGFASLLATIYSYIAYLRLQTRLATATDGFLDLASRDFFGSILPRLTSEADATFSGRIRREIIRDRNTRGAIDSLLFEMTGNHPEIVELGRPLDCFCWRRSGWRTGHLGSRTWGRCHVFIRTTHAGVFGFGIGGWRNPNAAWRTPKMVWADPSGITGTGFTDQQILDALERIRTAGVTYWVWITTLTGTILETESGIPLADESGDLFVI